MIALKVASGEVAKAVARIDGNDECQTQIKRFIK